MESKTLSYVNQLSQILPGTDAIQMIPSEAMNVGQTMYLIN